MPYFEVQIRLIPDPEPGSFEDRNRLVHVTGFPCGEFGPGPWNDENCASLMQDLAVFLRNRVGDFRLRSSPPSPQSIFHCSDPQFDQQVAAVQLAFETMVRNGITVDQEDADRLRGFISGGDPFVYKEPEPPPPTRFEREDVI